MRYRYLPALFLALAFPVQAQDARTFAELAEGADLIAVVMVDATDYKKTRSFPSSGSAFLRVLIPYRGTEKNEIIEVREEGLDDDACYYPEVNPFAFEGQRYLVMLRKHPEKAYYMGRAPGCRVPVLVTQDAGYAVLYPVEGLALEDPSVVREMEFADPNAVVDAADMTFAQRDRLENEYMARRIEDDDPLAPATVEYKYTRGIPLAEVRRMMFPEGRPASEE